MSASSENKGEQEQEQELVTPERRFTSFFVYLFVDGKRKTLHVNSAYQDGRDVLGMSVDDFRDQLCDLCDPPFDPTTFNTTAEDMLSGRLLVGAKEVGDTARRLKSGKEVGDTARRLNSGKARRGFQLTSFSDTSGLFGPVEEKPPQRSDKTLLLEDSGGKKTGESVITMQDVGLKLRGTMILYA